GLAKTVCLTAIGQSGLPDCRCDHISEPLYRELFAVDGHENCSIVAARNRELAMQLIVNRNSELRCGLLLRDPNSVTNDVSPCHSIDVRSPLSRVQKQRERQALARPLRPPSLKASNLAFIPRVNLLGLVCLHTSSSVSIGPTQRHGVACQGSDALQQN